MSYVDTPQKKQKHPHYDHRTNKLDKKDNEFTSKKIITFEMFQPTKNYQNHLEELECA